MIVRVGTLALACALVLALPAQAGVIDKAQKEAAAADERRPGPHGAVISDSAGIADF